MESVLGKAERYYWMGLAILWIVVFHLFTPILNLDSIPVTLRTWLSRLFGSGYLGVDIFLFISTYGICFSYVHNSFRTYILRRLRRLFPLFLLFIIPYLYFVGGFCDWESLSKATFLHITGLSVLTNMTYVWYIPATILIYWSFPMWFAVVKRIMTSNPYAIFILLIGMLFFQQFTVPYVYWLMNPRFVMIILGIATFFVQNSKNWDNQKRLQFFLLSSLVAVVFANSKTEIIGMSIPLLFYLIDTCKIKKVYEHALSYTGKYTLEIYLAQCIAIEHFTPPQTDKIIKS